MDDICRELGMSKKTLYTYYATKDELVEATLQNIRAHMQEKFDRFFAEHENISECILLFAERSMNSSDDVRKVPALVYDLNKYYPALAKKQSQLVYEQNVETMKKLLLEGKAEGLFRQDLDEETTAHLLAKLHSMAVEDSVEKPSYGLKADRIFHSTLDLLMRGIMSEDGLKKYMALKNNG